jgi:hypothetical protein
MDNEGMKKPALRISLAMAAFCCIFLLWCGSSLAMDTFFVGARGQAMAGANTASVNDYTAQYYNPAAFGFFARSRSGNEEKVYDDMGHRTWGVGLDAGAGARIQGDIATYTDELSNADLQSLTDGINSTEEARELVRLTSNLGGLDKPGNGVSVDFNAGTGIRAGHFAVGGRGLAQASATPNVQTSNLGISKNMTEVSQDIENNVDSGDGEIKLFSQDQKDALEDAGFSTNATQRLDYQARQAGVSQDQLDGMVEILEKVGDSSGDSTNATIEDNESSIFLRGFGLAEVPVSYGFALSDHFSVGGNLKLMRGRVYINEVLVFDEDSENFVENTKEQYEETTTFGVDIGFLARYKRFKLGVVGRNLNSPEFKAPTVNGTKFDDVTVDPQARAGISWQPFNSLILEADIDLTENETEFKGYHTRYLSAGMEWSVLSLLNLRAGMYTNLAEDDIGEVYTAGLGLNLLGANLEVAGAVSRKTEEYDGEEYPKEARVTAQLGLKF